MRACRVSQSPLPRPRPRPRPRSACPTHCTYLSIRLADAWQVDLGEECDLRRLVGVVGPAVDRQRVDAVLVHRVRRANDRPVPVAHQHVGPVVQAVAQRAIAQALLALLQLLQETEVARNCTTQSDRGGGRGGDTAVRHYDRSQGRRAPRSRPMRGQAATGICCDRRRTLCHRDAGRGGWAAGG